MPTHREELAGLYAEPDGSRRARLTLVFAVAGSLVLLATTALVVFLVNRPAEPAPPAVALPTPWNPPLLPEAEESSAPPPSALPSPEEPPVPTVGTADTTPPKAKPSPKPVTPALSVSQAPVPAVVDLSALGARDWVHWGLTSPEAVNRRGGGTGEIKELSVKGVRSRYDNNPQSFRWTGGAPTTTTGPSPTGLYVCQADGSFAFSVAASPTTRTLRLYAGVWMARGQLTATLAGRTVRASLENQQTNGTAVFVLTFKAPAGQLLRVTWANVLPFHPSCGNVDIQAATLS
ncbi:hypothetical protein [Paractinoplanes lichenicola]|uniref:Uncharacterized protein n=1 Tax=Paractinoplanes lichenicola TaxID=2802976 RepID=A0ABS1VHT8_9ACTN|nr:hypothetical protein [Actinoplanes lichenicola]MBL7253317.1 hypothetical protein [Actinoplanes lichenicola]